MKASWRTIPQLIPLTKREKNKILGRGFTQREDRDGDHSPCFFRAGLYPHEPAVPGHAQPSEALLRPCDDIRGDGRLPRAVRSRDLPCATTAGGGATDLRRSRGRKRRRRHRPARAISIALLRKPKISAATQTRENRERECGVRAGRPSERCPSRHYWRISGVGPRRTTCDVEGRAVGRRWKTPPKPSNEQWLAVDYGASSSLQRRANLYKKNRSFRV